MARHAIYRSSGDEALIFLEQAHEILKSLGPTVSTIALANTMSGIGFSLKELNQIEAATKALDQAIELLRNSDYPFLADSLRTRGSWLGEIGNWKSALESYTEAAHINEINGVKEFYARDLLQVANCHYQMGAWSESISTALKARSIFKVLKMIGELSWCDLNIAKAHIEMNEGEHAMAWSQRALDIGTLRKDNEMICKASYALAKGHMITSNLAKAENLLLEAQDIVSNSGDWSQLIQIEEALISIYLETNRESQASEAKRRLSTLKEAVQ